MLRVSYFFIGLKCLGEGKSAKARGCFEKCISSGGFFTWQYWVGASLPGTNEGRSVAKLDQAFSC
jgi:hypothetical protein